MSERIQNRIHKELKRGRAPKQAVGCAYASARRSKPKKGIRTQKKRGRK